MDRRLTLLRYFVAFVISVLAGCAAATPFQPNANASNAATNSATASPKTQVTLHPTVPASQPPQPAHPPTTQSTPNG